MTKKEILKNLIKVIDILSMDYEEYIEYRKHEDMFDEYFSTDFYTVFGLLCDECISELSSIILSCSERFNIGDFAFLNGRFVVSNRVLTHEEYIELKTSKKRFMLKYGKSDFSKIELERMGY